MISAFKTLFLSFFSPRKNASHIINIGKSKNLKRIIYIIAALFTITAATLNDYTLLRIMITRTEPFFLQTAAIFILIPLFYLAIIWVFSLFYAIIIYISSTLFRIKEMQWNNIFSFAKISLIFLTDTFLSQIWYGA